MSPCLLYLARICDHHNEEAQAWLFFVRTELMKAVKIISSIFDILNAMSKGSKMHVKQE